MRHINPRAKGGNTEDMTKKVILFNGLDAAGGFGETAAIGGVEEPFHANMGGVVKEAFALQ